MKPRFMSKPLMEVVFCVAKRGEYSFDDGSTKARLLSECEKFKELRDMSVLFMLSNDDVVNDATLEEFGRLMDYPMPELDRMLRWPWEEDYEDAP